MEHSTMWFMDLLASTGQRSYPDAAPSPRDRRRVVLRLQARALARLLAAQR